MQILYVGNGNLKHRGARYYDVGRKLMNGLIRLGHHVYFFSDRDTARAASPLGARKLGVKHCNRAFIETCRQLKPEFILLGHADIISNDALAEVQAMLPDVKIAQFNVDPVFRAGNINMIKQKLPHVDATFITTGGPILKRFAHPRGQVCFMPNPVDPSMERAKCHEHSDQPYDMFWALRAMQHNTPGDPRIELPVYLAAQDGIVMDYHGMRGRAELFGAAYYERIAQNKMGLNISVVRTHETSPRAQDEELYLYASDRISHYLGCGLLTFATRDNRLEELLKEDEEMIYFSTAEELTDKVRYYLKHDGKRREIAAKGWHRAHTDFNVRMVAQYILDVTFQSDMTYDYGWPSERY